MRTAELRARPRPRTGSCTRRTRARAAVATVGGNVARRRAGCARSSTASRATTSSASRPCSAPARSIRCGGRLVKDVAGYDLRAPPVRERGHARRCITELTLRLVPAPEASGVGLAYFDSLADAGRAVSRALAGGVLPATLEFLDRTCIADGRGLRGHRPAHRRGRAAHLRPGRRARGDRARPASGSPTACATEGAIEVRVAADGGRVRRRARGAPRRAAVPVAPGAADDPRGRDGAAVAASPRWSSASRRSPQRHELVIGTFGHAGDGNLHPTCVLDPRRRRRDRARPPGLRRDLPRGASSSAGRSPASTASGCAKLPLPRAPAGRRPDRAPAADQGGVRPRRASSTPESSAREPDQPAARAARDLHARSCSTAASPAASACPPARPTR